jgi:hypothetical protein
MLVMIDFSFPPITVIMNHWGFVAKLVFILYYAVAGACGFVFIRGTRILSTPKNNKAKNATTIIIITKFMKTFFRVAQSIRKNSFPTP